MEQRLEDNCERKNERSPSGGHLNQRCADPPRYCLVASPHPPSLIIALSSRPIASRSPLNPAPDVRAPPARDLQRDCSVWSTGQSPSPSPAPRSKPTTGLQSSGVGGSLDQSILAILVYMCVCARSLCTSPLFGFL